MIVRGDCVALMAELAEGSVDAIVTDPPYGLEFMGKEWDAFRLDDTGTARHRGDKAGSQGSKGGADRWGENGRSIPSSRTSFGGGKRPTTNRCVGCGKRDQFRNAHGCPEGTAWRVEIIDPHAAPPTMLAFQEWSRVWAREALRVLKPGGHLLAFGGTRTYHRLACAIEDAGFEIRDCLAWLYGSGFPKSLDVSKAIDKAAGAEREVIGRRADADKLSFKGKDGTGWDRPWMHEDEALERCRSVTAPATREAVQWQGWGTALKPAHEPIVLARKPLAGTVAGNVLEHGTGALNVDGCRIDHNEPTKTTTRTAARFKESENGGVRFSGSVPEQSTIASADPSGRWPANVVLDERAAEMLDQQTGGEESRFLYVAKASSAERNAGLDGFEAEFSPTMNNGIGGKEHDPETATRKRNVHPTVKPIELMRWLVRLITPPEGVVLDPFTGSGTTGCAAALEGFDFLGFEREAEYVKIAEARIAWWSQHPDGLEIVKALEAERERKAIRDSGQLDLLA